MTARIIPSRSIPPALPAPEPRPDPIRQFAEAFARALARIDHLSQTRRATGEKPHHERRDPQQI